MARIKQTEAVIRDAATPKRGRPPKAAAQTGAQAAEMRVTKETSPQLSGKPLPGMESIPVEWQELYLAISREVRGE